MMGIGLAKERFREQEHGAPYRDENDQDVVCDSEGFHVVEDATIEEENAEFYYKVSWLVIFPSIERWYDVLFRGSAPAELFLLQKIRG